MARILVLAVAAALTMVLGVAPSWAQNAYISNVVGNVSVIATASNTPTGSLITTEAGAYGVAVTPDGTKVYVTNFLANTVSVIDTATNTVTATIPVGTTPVGVAVTADGSTVYVVNQGVNSTAGGTVSVISTATEAVVGTFDVGHSPFGVAVAPTGDTGYVTNGADNTVSLIPPITVARNVIIPVGSDPAGIAVTSDGSKVYVANQDNNVSVINTATNKVSATISDSSFNDPIGIAVTPDGSKVYVANSGLTTISVIDTATNKVTGTVAVGSNPVGVAVTPNGNEVYVANAGSNTVSVIATASDTVTATLSVGTNPKAFGKFIGPALPARTLTVSATGTGSGQVTSSPAGINCSHRTNQCAASFAGTTTVTLTASATGGSIFTGWSGSGCNGTGACVIDLVANTTVSAGFAAAPSFPLSVTLGGTGSGTVTSNPSGITCPGMCSASYQSGTQVVLTATPAGGATFAGWAGAGCTGTGTCTVTMSAAESVMANFTAPPATLSVTEAGTGAGQVTSVPAGINCSPSSILCSAPFAVGTQVTLTASASSGSSFTGWSGGPCNGTGACQLTLSANATVTATFNHVPSKLLSVARTGNGTVTSTPSGINCGSTCSASFATGTQVSLSAAAAGGSTFLGWAGGGCSGIDACTLTLNANTTVNATFILDDLGHLTLVAAVLPLSRSVQTGVTATAFATMINAGPDNASTCTIAPATGVPASFVFQTTDPTTNALTGTANTPVNIAAGQAQSFVIALTPSATFAPTDITFTFTCANAPSSAASTVGIDTLNLSGSATPVPDIVALAASSDPGYVDIPGATGTGDFAVATVNLGSAAQITVGANTGTANLPVTLLLCQTDPTSGACLAPPAATVTTSIAANATPTFGVFVTGGAAVADMPGVNRIFVTFTDSGGTLRGETSVAVRTQ